VKLLFDEREFYNGSVEALEMFKASRGFGGIEPVVIFFSDDDDRGRKSVNFSRFDKPKLVIHTEDDRCESPLYVVAMNSQILRYMDGMYALAFSS
jgi:hypothetical protein